MSARALLAAALLLGSPAIAAEATGAVEAPTLLPTPAPPPASAPAPYVAMRALQRLQDRIAAGDTAAAAAHAKAIARTATAFAAVRPAAWSEGRNANALVLYLFSGGDAAAMERAVPRSAVPKAMGGLFDGALAYGLGRDDAARAALLDLDAKGLASGLGGHLALIQATLLADRDKAKAIERLDLARLLAPGTLVEEAALRKELGLIDPLEGDITKFAQLAHRYSGGFPHSLYKASFWQVVRGAAFAIARAPITGSAAVPHTATDPSKAWQPRLRQVVTSLDTADARHLFLSVARDALLVGRMDVAAFAAEQAQTLSRAGQALNRAEEADQARAQIYFGAAAIAGPRLDSGRAALSIAAGKPLDPGDEALRAAALAVSDTIRDPAFAAAPARGNTDAAAIREAERALRSADAALMAAKR